MANSSADVVSSVDAVGVDLTAIASLLGGNGSSDVAVGNQAGEGVPVVVVDGAGAVDTVVTEEPKAGETGSELVRKFTTVNGSHGDPIELLIGQHIWNEETETEEIIPGELSVRVENGYQIGIYSFIDGLRFTVDIDEPWADVKEINHRLEVWLLANRANLESKGWILGLKNAATDTASVGEISQKAVEDLNPAILLAAINPLTPKYDDVIRYLRVLYSNTHPEPDLLPEQWLPRDVWDEYVKIIGYAPPTQLKLVTYPLNIVSMLQLAFVPNITFKVRLGQVMDLLDLKKMKASFRVRKSIRLRRIRDNNSDAAIALRRLEAEYENRLLMLKQEMNKAKLAYKSAKNEFEEKRAALIVELGDGLG